MFVLVGDTCWTALDLIMSSKKNPSDARGSLKKRHVRAPGKTHEADACASTRGIKAGANGASKVSQVDEHSMSNDIAADAHGLSSADRRNVFKLMREAYSSRHRSSLNVEEHTHECQRCAHAVKDAVHSTLVEKHVVRVWAEQTYNKPPDESKSTDAADAKSDDALSETILDGFNQIECLRQAFSEVAVDNSEVAQLLRSISQSTNAMKFSLAALCDQAASNLGVLEHLTSSFDSISHSAHDVLITWMQELQQMRKGLERSDLQLELDDRMSCRVSLAIDDCLQSVSALADAWKNDERNLADAECHVLLKMLGDIQGSGFPSGQADMNSSPTTSPIQRERSGAIGDDQEDLCAEVDALLQDFKANQKQEACLEEDSADACSIKSSGSTHPEHDFSQSMPQSPCNETSDMLPSCRTTQTTDVIDSSGPADPVGMAPSGRSEPLVGELPANNDCSHQGLLPSGSVMPPRQRPLHKHRPAPLPRQSCDLPMVVATRDALKLALAGTSSPQESDLVDEEARKDDDVCTPKDGEPNQPQKPQQARPLGRFSRGRVMAVHGRFTPPGSMSPKGSRSPAMSREPSRQRRRSSQPLIAILNRFQTNGSSHEEANATDSREWDSIGTKLDDALSEDLLDAFQQIGCLRQAFSEIAVEHSELTKLLRNISYSTNSVKFSLAALCDREASPLGTLDHLIQSFDSISYSAHDVLLIWVEELRLMHDGLAQSALQLQLGNDINGRLSRAVINCLQSTVALAHAWKDEKRNLLDAQCDILLAFLERVLDHGLFDKMGPVQTESLEPLTVEQAFRRGIVEPPAMDQSKFHNTGSDRHNKITQPAGTAGANVMTPKPKLQKHRPAPLLRPAGELPALDFTQFELASSRTTTLSSIDWPNGEEKGRVMRGRAGIRSPESGLSPKGSPKGSRSPPMSRASSPGRFFDPMKIMSLGGSHRPAESREPSPRRQCEPFSVWRQRARNEERIAKQKLPSLPNRRQSI